VHFESRDNSTILFQIGNYEVFRTNDVSTNITIATLAMNKTITASHHYTASDAQRINCTTSFLASPNRLGPMLI
jgi:ABC-type polar amino acid transport system ATPase subunit